MTKAVLTVGALASAVTAVLALLPSSSSDSEDSARFTTVRVTPEVPLGEYRQRTAALVPEGGDEAGFGRFGAPGVDRAHRSAAVVPDVPMQPIGRRSSPRPGSQPPETDPGGSPDTSTPGDPQDTEPPPTPPDGTVDGTSDDTSVDGSSSTDTSLDPTSTDSTESTDTSADAPPADASDSTVVLSTPALERTELDLRDYSDEVIAIVGEALGCPAPGGSATGADDPRCDRTAQTLLPIVVANATDVEGDPLPPAEAAERVVRLLRSTRVDAGEPGEAGSVTGDGETAPEPLGVVVTADLELGGLRGEPVMLSWSMWRQGDGGRLYGEWLNENVAYRLEATTDRDTTSVDLWIPLPPEPGPYTVRVQLTRDGSRLASASTDPFT